MKKIVLLLMILVFHVSCSKKEENVKAQQSSQSITKIAAMVSQDGVSIDNLKYNGQKIAGDIQNRNTKELDSLVVLIEFINPEGEIDLRQKIELVPGADYKTIIPGYAKKITYTFPFEYWNEKWLGINVKFLQLKFAS